MHQFMRVIDVNDMLMLTMCTKFDTHVLNTQSEVIQIYSGSIVVSAIMCVAGCCRMLQCVAVLLHSLFREYSDLTNHIKEDFAGQCFYCFNDILMFVEAPDY